MPKYRKRYNVVGMPDINESQIPKQPTSAPEVPKELLSARQPMAKVTPQSPDKIAEASQAMVEHDPEPETEQEAEQYDEPTTPEQDRQNRIDYLRNLSDKQPKKSKTNIWLVIALVILALLVVATALYLFVLRPNSKTEPTKDTAEQSQSTPTTSQPASSNPNSEQTPPTMKEYDSTNFQIVLKVPSDWTTSDAPGKLTLTSTPMQLTDSSGSQKTGAIVVTIRGKQTKLPEFTAGNATAVLTSERLKYTSPVAGQRDSTYLSFLQYNGTTTKGSLDSIYITGNAGYQKGQNIPEVDVTKVDPLVTVSFIECSTKCTADAKSLTVSSSVWSGQLKATVDAILQSLQLS